MQIDTLSQINDVINSLVRKGNFKQANNLNKLFIKMAQAPNSVVNNSPSGTTTDASGNPTAEGGGLPTAPGQPQQQGAQNAAKQVDQNMMNIIKQFIALKEYAKSQTPPAFYAYSRGQFTVGKPDNTTISAPTVGELFAQLGVTNVEIKELVDDVKTQADKIASEISSANSWSGATPEASKAINDKYDLGFNFENNQYYIGDPKNPNDVQYSANVAGLESVYNELGAYFNTNKTLPASLSQRGTVKPKEKENEEDAKKKGVDVTQLPHGTEAGIDNMDGPNSSAENINSQILA